MFYLRPLRIMMFLVVSAFAWAGCWAGEEQAEVSVENYFLQLEYGSYSQALEQNSYLNLESQPGQAQGLNPDIYGAKSKSTRKAFLYSLLLPGSGQFYGESKVKAAAFLGLEALFWVGYFHYDGKGDDKTKEYRSFADANWNPALYRDSLAYTYFQENRRDYITPQGETLGVAYYPDSILFEKVRNNEDIIYDMEETLSVITGAGFTHHSVKISKKEYYENIGKYEQFAWGWEDYMNNPVTALRTTFLDMRQDANSLYDKAKWAVVASMANHILSAVDAALTVKKFNRKQDRFSEANLRIRMVPEPEGLSPRAVLSVKFR